MTMHTNGWVEVPDPFWHEPGSSEWVEQGPRWTAILHLQPLITWDLVDWGSNMDWAAIHSATHPGFPDDASARVRDEYACDEAMYAGVYEPLWATWRVWATLPWNQPPDSAWSNMMDILEILATKYGPDYVRIFLWEAVIM